MRLLLSLFVLGLPSIASAQVIYLVPGNTYTQDFNTLVQSGTGQSWSNNSTLTGWFLYRQPAPGTDITTYNAGTGSSNAGNFYSFGSSTTDSDRSLGGVGSGGAYFGSPSTGSVAGWIAVGITNSTGQALSSFTMTYNGEQWRDGGAATPTAQTMVVEYGFGTSFTTVASWTPAGSGFNFTSPVFANTSTGAAVDGNTAGLIAGLGGSVNTTWNTGDTLWIRFVETNDAGNDHGLSVDNFNFAAFAASVPEPSTYALVLTTLVFAGMTRYRRMTKKALPNKVG